MDADALRRRRWLTVVVMMATIMQALDGTIANVALPNMQGSLSATQEQVAWVITSYIVSAAIATPLAGFCAVRFGVRRILVSSVIGFTIASMLCGAAQTLEQLVLFRALQGVCGASLVPLSQTLMMEAYRREEQGKAMAMWGVGTMLGPITGPTLGGWLTDEYSWRWVFYINLPVGILCTVGLMILVKNKAADSRRPFDLLGFTLLSIAIGTFQLMLDRGEQIDWFGAREIVIEAVVAGVAACMFVIHMLSDDHPFLPRDLFRDRNLMLGIIFTAITGLLMIVTATLLPPFLQQLKGYPVFTTGVVMAPRGVGTMLTMFLVSRLIGRMDARWLIAIGLSLCGISLYDMTQFTLDVDEGRVVWNGFLQGLGLGLIFPPLTTLAFATIPARIRTEGAAINALMRNLGASVGVAVLEATLSRNIQISRSEMAEHLTAFNPFWRLGTTPMEHGIPVDRSRLLDYMMPFGGSWPFGLVPTDDPSKLVAMWSEELTRQAATIAYLNDFRILGAATVIFIPLLFFMRRQAMLAVPTRR
ncbi:MFS transporter, DHA2 family, multidrug resistance protein [Enhydrobacter aerosaccus]|uniref:MFS transporter, DHA2 family, multidrug resistance protein n=1 Tax=Enhydrobacter aerosaccus TaxID=225324 RepID=A0A1T4TFD9_9HYPH|nr:DHA2 family efflux MFS transporter permease subunit [Enhydrobacter aerosaccus]SKA39166.1 MFS transporter, DHA2 family, multidrug resistance protein [Enhydrobacter aerosaccus]